MSSISVVICSHDNEEGLRNTLRNLVEQTYSGLDDYDKVETIILSSGEPYSKQYLSREIYHRHIKNYNDHGHVKRAMGTMLATKKYVTFWNDDDYYAPQYLEKMINAAEYHQADIVACDFKEKTFGGGVLAPVEPRTTRVTAGCFIVNTELAQWVGWNHRHYEADGAFVEDIVRAGGKWYRVPEVLYDHR